MTIWAPSLQSRDGPRYLAIAEALGRDVAAGVLRAGDRLPTHRELAHKLGVTVGTVSRAYAEAERRGLTGGHVGRGTYVRADPGTAARGNAALEVFSIPDRPVSGLIDLGLNLPPVGEAGRALAAAMADLSRNNDLTQLLTYQPGGGVREHRRAGSAWLSRFGIKADPDHVTVCNGAQHGILVSLMAMTRPGDRIVCEALTYPGVKAMADTLGIVIDGLAMDAEGIVPDAFEHACRSTPPKLLYCQPTLQNPTATTMSDERRRNIAAIARRHGVAIIEDDVYGFLPLERPPALATYAPEISFVVTSASKSMAPGLRVGFVHSPANRVEAVRSAVRLTNWMTPPLMAEVARRWIDDGTGDALVAAHREKAAALQRTTASILDGVPYQTQPVSYHFWLPLPAPWRADPFAAEVERRGVRVLPAETFAVGKAAPPHGVRVCLGAEPDASRVAHGLRTIADTVADSGCPSFAVV